MALTTSRSKGDTALQILAIGTIAVREASVQMSSERATNDLQPENSEKGNDTNNSKKKRKSRTNSQQAAEAVTGTPRDVLCGRGFHIMNHHGNLQLHLLVNKYKPQYFRSRQNEKIRIVESIIRQMKETGARFLRRVKKEDAETIWVEADHACAYEKVSHALRLQRKNKSSSLKHAPTSNHAQRNEFPESSLDVNGVPNDGQLTGNAARQDAPSAAPSSSLMTITAPPPPMVLASAAPVISLVPVTFVPTVMGVNITNNALPMLVTSGGTILNGISYESIMASTASIAAQSRPQATHAMYGTTTNL